MQRHYFINKGLTRQTMDFPVVMYGCESWTIKKANRWRFDAFELRCWRRLLQKTARRSSQSILKEISPEYSLEGLILKLKHQYFGQLTYRINSLEKTLMLGKTEGGRRRGRQRMRWLDGITDSMDMGLSKPRDWWWTGKPGVLQSMGSQSRTRLSDWTELRPCCDLSGQPHSKKFPMAYQNIRCNDYYCYLNPTDISGLISRHTSHISNLFTITSRSIFKHCQVAPHLCAFARAVFLA